MADDFDQKFDDSGQVVVDCSDLQVAADESNRGDSDWLDYCAQSLWDGFPDSSQGLVGFD